MLLPCPSQCFSPFPNKMAEYKGSASEARKAKALEKQRQEQQAEFERLKQKAKEENAVSGVRTIGTTAAHVS